MCGGAQIPQGKDLSRNTDREALATLRTFFEKISRRYHYFSPHLERAILGALVQTVHPLLTSVLSTLVPSISEVN